MRLVEFYSLRRSKIEKEKLLFKREKNQEKRAIHKEMIWRLESELTDIAHCIALFGNLSRIRAKKLIYDDTTKVLVLKGRNPWLNGLSIFVLS